MMKLPDIMTEPDWATGIQDKFHRQLIYNAQFEMRPYHQQTVITIKLAESHLRHLLKRLGAMRAVWAWLADMPHVTYKGGYMTSAGYEFVYLLSTEDTDA